MTDTVTNSNFYCGRAIEFHKIKFINRMIVLLRRWLTFGSAVIFVTGTLAMYLDWGRIQAIDVFMRVLEKRNHAYPPQWAILVSILGISIAALNYLLYKVNSLEVSYLHGLVSEALLETAMACSLTFTLLCHLEVQKASWLKFGDISLSEFNFTKALENVQFEFECCGLIDDSYYKNVVLPEGKQVPSSCCINQYSTDVDDTLCQSLDPMIYVNERFEMGCLEVMKKWLYGSNVFVVFLFGAAVLLMMVKISMLVLMILIMRSQAVPKEQGLVINNAREMSIPTADQNEDAHNKEAEIQLPITDKRLHFTLVNID